MFPKTNGRKASGPIAKALVNVLMPIALKAFLTPERMFGWSTRIGSIGTGS
jgi:hypothetical protein